MKICEKMALDFARSGIRQRMYAVQGDSYARCLEIAMQENGAAWELPVGASAFLRYRKPDGTGGMYDTLPDGTQAWSAQGNRVNFTLAPQMLSVPGIVQVQLEIVSGASNLASFAFLVEVEPDPSLGVIPSEDYVSWNAWAMQALENLFTVGDTQPDAVPALWFDTAPQGAGAQTTVLDRVGNGTPVYPITKQECVEGLEEALAGKAPGGFGLGAMVAPQVDNWDNAKGTGYFRSAYGGPTNAEEWHGFNCYRNSDSFSQVVFKTWGDVNLVCMRKYINGTFDEWEWVNPPMKPGEEYRTTERWDGAPVYRKMIAYYVNESVGTVVFNIPHDIENFGSLVRVTGLAGGRPFPVLFDRSEQAVLYAVNATQITMRCLNSDTGSGYWYFDLAYTKA